MSTDAELARGLVAVALVIGFVIWFAFMFLLQGCGTVPARG